MKVKTMIRLMIVEDEKATAADLKQMVEGLCSDMEVCSVCYDGETALKDIQQVCPDVIFLDVELPGLRGIEVAQALQEMEKVPLIVFVTAYVDFAVQAFSVNALDYMVKPVSKRCLARVLLKIKKRMQQIKSSRVGKESDSYLRKLTINKGDRLEIIDCQDIRLIYGKNRQVFIMTKDDEVCRVKITLQEFEERLAGTSFFRCHRNYIVNVDEIKQITTWFKQRYLLILKGKKNLEIPVGRAYVNNLRQHVEF
ncbi:LytTR family DNA-binding domain-containing protein [uncultured Megasphaera sp.]|uniref:LytR/AlgR family response regulator transcription factor n=1 Tax=uncultured Megasphaera sp. TaxID=165188 RepID=UPI0025969359|nr:LytTR family DNA-binding domain-containing protein [uncultured Megasphaera sp.]